MLRASVLDRVAESVRLLARLGFDVSARGRQDLPIEEEWETPLHCAAGDGKLELARVLLELVSILPYAIGASMRRRSAGRSSSASLS